MRLQILLGVVLSALSYSTSAATGEYWEMSNKMEMQGMSLPAMTHKICIAKGAENDPRHSADKDCEITETRSFGNKSSWKMRCVKDGEVMTGTGEMSGTPDRTEGKMTFNSAKTGNMAMSFVNKRVGGACDPDEMKKKVEAIQDNNSKLMAQQQAQVCDIYRKNLGRDVARYFELKGRGVEFTKPCGIDMGATKQTLCKSVDANNADFARQIKGDSQAYKSSLQAECPREMKTYMEVSRKRFCEGRGFTEKQRMSLADCLKGASGDDEAMNTADPEEPPMPAGKSTGTQKTATVDKQAPANSNSNSNNSNSNSNSNSEQNNTIKLPGGITLPGIPGGSGGSGSDAILDGAKKLKNLFGL